MRLGAKLTGLILFALVMWARMLCHIFASSINTTTSSQQGAPISCAIDEVVLWSPRVVMQRATLPAAVHIGAEGKIVAVVHGARAEAEAYAARHRVRLEAHGQAVISPGVVD
eukprot:4295755-Prymnesium_polylepis.1